PAKSKPAFRAKARDGVRRDVVVIGGSAGGVEALQAVAAGLPADLAAAVLVVLHVSPASPGVLPKILARAGPLTAEYARDGQPAKPGAIYVAPPGRHLVIAGDV